VQRVAQEVGRKPFCLVAKICQLASKSQWLIALKNPTFLQYDLGGDFSE
jgi:hypothetical protein